jgi:hypothetical protein
VSDPDQTQDVIESLESAVRHCSKSEAQIDFTPKQNAGRNGVPIEVALEVRFHEPAHRCCDIESLRQHLDGEWIESTGGRPEIHGNIGITKFSLDLRFPVTPASGR